MTVDAVSNTYTYSRLAMMKLTCEEIVFGVRYLKL